MSSPVLQLKQRQIDRIVSQARAQAGVEVCGLLGGQAGQVMGVYPVRNCSPTPAVSFLMADQSFIDAYLGIEARGWDLVAIYHSHPSGARTDPSPTDIANANYPEALNLIVSFDENGQPVLRVFQITDGCVREVALAITPEDT